ncbi:glycoside hydrolase superfamily [Dunaliella salina]|uniref:Beta-amylase n=1 Tax=Dunaliella salina TaxID=3046 RepID=A0ABQ7GFH4_DUNSA|nr:glycoside hydrolase superfamily [Dunaliella salina]|eukprot:KAF5833355.1 glycoside hydrolase superfamily [Dunaliella salina]
MAPSVPLAQGLAVAPQMQCDGCGGQQEMHAARGKGCPATERCRNLSKPTSCERKKVPVLTMLPLDTVTSSGFTYANQPWFAQALHVLAQSGAHGVAVDVWWGAVEREPRAYNWSGYKQLFEVIKKTGLKAQVVLGFHACGCNVGDNTQIPLPPWVLQCGDHDPDLFFTDRPRDGGLGQRNREYLSIWADDAPGVLMGRSPMQCYEDFMVNFRDAFRQELGTLIEEVLIGSGPCGELRYPSYVEAHGWKFPGVGEFQCYDRRALASLAQAAREAGSPDWGYGGPHNAGTYCSNPEETEFFAHQGSWDTQYGRFFLRWYSKSLLCHGEQLMAIASRVFAPHTRRRRRHHHQQLSSPAKPHPQQQQQQQWQTHAAGAMGMQGPTGPASAPLNKLGAASLSAGVGGWQGGGFESCALASGPEGGEFVRSRTSLGGPPAYASPHHSYNHHLHHHQHPSLQRASYGGPESSGRTSWGRQLSSSGAEKGDLTSTLPPHMPHSPHSHSQLGSPHYLSGRPVSMTLVASSSSMASGGGGGGGPSSSVASNLHAAGGGGSSSTMVAAAAAAAAAPPTSRSGPLSSSSANNNCSSGFAGGGGLVAGDSLQPLVSSRSMDPPQRGWSSSGQHASGNSEGGAHRSGGGRKSLSGNNMADADSALIAGPHQHAGGERAGEQQHEQQPGGHAREEQQQQQPGVALNGQLAEPIRGQHECAGVEEVGGHAGRGSSSKSAWVQDGLGASGSKARLAVRSSGNLVLTNTTHGDTAIAIGDQAQQGMSQSQPKTGGAGGGGGDVQGGGGSSHRSICGGSSQLPLHAGGDVGGEGSVQCTEARSIGALLSEGGLGGDAASLLGASGSHNFLYRLGGGGSLSDSSAGGSMQVGGRSTQEVGRMRGQLYEEKVRVLTVLCVHGLGGEQIRGARSGMGDNLGQAMGDNSGQANAHYYCMPGNIVGRVHE